MSIYRIGRDIEELRHRIECIERSQSGSDSRERMRSVGRSFAHHEQAGVPAGATPVEWKLEAHERISPLITSMFGLPLAGGRQFDIAPQSKTWGCSPEPLVFSVNWDAGGTDEFFRLENQTFNAIKWTDPNTGTSSARFSYNATLVASGRAKSVQDVTGRMSFQIAVRNAQGAPIQYSNDYYWVDCGDNRLVSFGASINPGLYDLIAGATWSNIGCRVLHC